MAAFRLAFVLLLVVVAVVTIITPVSARDSLGVFSDWGAFRDAETPRCYAIAKPASRRETAAFASVGTWPRRGVRGQVHFRLSQAVRAGAKIQLTIGRRSFTLAGSGNNAWAKDRRGDAAIVAAMRSASRMTVAATNRQGRGFSDRYPLAGAATAMDAATVACARRR